MNLLNFATLHTFYTAYRDSDFLGKLIFLGLFTSSIICWCILIYKMRMIRRAEKLAIILQKDILLKETSPLRINLESDVSSKRELANPLKEVFQSFQQKTTEILRKNHFFNQNTSFLTRSDLDLIESHVLTTISTQVKFLDKNLFILTTIITLGPFLGLLGTVWGILITFAGLQSGASINSNHAVLGGLSTALTTTVIGLLIAIPALVGYNYLKNSVKTLTGDMEDFLYTLLSRIEIEYRKVDKD